MRPFSGFGSIAYLTELSSEALKKRQLEKQQQEKIEEEARKQEMLKQKQEATEKRQQQIAMIQEEERKIKEQRDEIFGKIRDVKNNTEIYTLDFSNNTQFDEVTASHLVDALRFNFRIRELTADCSKVSNNLQKLISDQLIFNSELHEKFKRYTEKNSAPLVTYDSAESLFEGINEALRIRDEENIEMEILLFCFAGDVIEKKYLEYHERTNSEDREEFKNEKGVKWLHAVIHRQSEISKQCQEILRDCGNNEESLELDRQVQKLKRFIFTEEGKAVVNQNIYKGFLREEDLLKDKDFILECLQYRDNIRLAEANKIKNVYNLILKKPKVRLESDYSVSAVYDAKKNEHDQYSSYDVSVMASIKQPKPFLKLLIRQKKC